MELFGILLLGLLVLGVFPRKSKGQADRKYYDKDGYHIYYDRKILRQIKKKQQKEHQTHESNINRKA